MMHVLFPLPTLALKSDYSGLHPEPTRGCITLTCVPECTRVPVVYLLVPASHGPPPSCLHFLSGHVTTTCLPTSWPAASQAFHHNRTLPVQGQLVLTTQTSNLQKKANSSKTPYYANQLDKRQSMRAPNGP